MREEMSANQFAKFGEISKLKGSYKRKDYVDVISAP